MQRFDPIVIYQMGKVGSKTIQASLEKLNLPNKICHIHFLSWSNIKQIEDHYSSIPGTNVRLDHCKNIRSLIDSTAGNIRWKIITLVRDPVARDISDVFENIKRDLPHVTNVDPESAFNDIRSHILKTFADFNESTDYACTWFDKEIKDVFNFDIYANDFNKSTGYQIYRVQDADILLIRLEDLSRCCHDAFREFLGVLDFSMVKDNVSEKKWYQGLYRRVLDSISIPDSDLERIYKSRYCRHFYTGDEINHFKKKWSGEKTEIKSVTVASSQRNSSNSGKILIVHPEGNINNNPNLTGIVEILCENGYKVDICSLRRSNIYQYSWCAGASLFLLDRPENLVKNGTFILEDPKLNSQEKIISYINENFKSYDLVIGVDRGIIEAALIAQNREIPCGLISYEIFFEEETSREFKQEEIEACKCLDFIVCQDELRAKYLSIENKIALEKIINIPVAGRGIKKGEKNSYLYDSLGIDKDKKIALFMGSVAQWSMADYILESAKLWSEDWVLVVHSRYGLDQHVRPYYEKYKHLDNIYFSLEPIADPNKMHRIIHSADIGLAFYKPLENNIWAGNNIRYLGMASGKIATYLQHGLPIIINEIGRMSDYVRKYELGLVVDDNGNFNTPLTDGQLLKFRLNCLEFFEKRLDLNHTIVPLLKIIQRLSDKQAVTVSSENSLALGTKDFLAGKVEHPVINSAEKYNLSGEELLGRKDIDGALNAFKKAIEVAPHFIAAHNNIGKAYLQKGELANALKHFTNALKINPYDLATVLNCGQVLTSHGLVQEARSLYRSYLWENPNDNKVIQALESLNCEKRIEGRDDVTPEYKKDLIARAEHIAMEQNQGDVESRKYLVTAIVSTYNSERFIRRCLEDLENQSISDRLEIIVVNSGSQQNEEAIVREFQSRYDNIKYIKTEERETIYKAWNRAIKAASGKYITNANTDDRHTPHMLERLAAELDRNKNIAAVYSHFYVTTVENQTWETKTPERMSDWHPPYSREALLKSNFMGPQPMWRKSLHDEYGYFDQTLKVSGDYEFFLRVSQTHDFLLIPEPLGLYLFSPNSLERTAGTRDEEDERIWNLYRNNKHKIICRPFRPDDPTFSIQTDHYNNEKSNGPALDYFLKAGNELNRENFEAAMEYMQQYRSMIDYSKLPRILNKSRKHGEIDVSVIIVTYNRTEDLKRCLESLSKQDDANFEVIVVDNGGSDFEVFQQYVDQYIKCPINLILSEGRNIGACCAKGKIIAFLDDDALVSSNYVSSIKSAFDQFDIFGLRGKAYPKSSSNANNHINVYDLGDKPFPSYCNQEGNSAWLLEVYKSMDGMDPLLFGHEGNDLSYRIIQKYKQPNKIIYWPQTIIYHDYGSGEKHEQKQKIYHHNAQYLKYKHNADILANKREIEKYPLPLKQDRPLTQELSLAPGVVPVEDKPSFAVPAETSSFDVPKVSIVISCHNSEKFLPQCLDSIRNQTMRDWELLILDDGSTDATKSIIIKYCQMDQRIKAFCFADNKGPYVRRNFAIQKATSGFIVIQDDDDIMLPEKLQMLYDEITKDQRLGIIGSFYRRFLDEFESLENTETTELALTHEQIMEQTKSQCDFCWHGSAIIRKSMFDSIGSYDENPFGSDSFWLAKAAEFARYTNEVRFQNIPQLLTLRRMHANSQTGLLPSFDPRSPRAKFVAYWKGKLQNLKEKLSTDPSLDIKVELKNCKCSDFIERNMHLFAQWEKEPLGDVVLSKVANKAIESFNDGKFITVVTQLNGLEKIYPDIAQRFRNYDLLQAMAYLALAKKDHSLNYLNREIQNHANPAAKQVVHDYFENHLEKDVRSWCMENSTRYDLRMIDIVAAPQSHDKQDPVPEKYTDRARTAEVVKVPAPEETIEIADDTKAIFVQLEQKYYQMPDDAPAKQQVADKLSRLYHKIGLEAKTGRFQIKTLKIKNSLEFEKAKVSKPGVCRHKPVRVEFQVINRCNARCIMCGYGPEGEHFDLDRFKQIADEVLPEAKDVLLIGGEVLMHPNFYEICEYTNRYGISLGMTTNLYSLANERTEAIRNFFSDIRVSIDGATKQTYEGIRTALSFDKLQKNLEMLSEIKRHSRLRLSWEFVAMRQNIQELPTAVEMACCYGFDNMTVGFVHVRQKVKLEDSLLFNRELANKYFDLAREKAKELGLHLNTPSHFDLSQKPYLVPYEITDGYKKCVAPWERVRIFSNGKLIPCCHLGLSPGNVFDAHFAEIWNGQKYRELRNAIREGSDDMPDRCKHCQLAAKRTNSNDAMLHISSDSKSIAGMQAKLEEVYGSEESKVVSIGPVGRLRPKVSIIISCYNSGKFLPECLDSIRNQTMNEWELFLLDDASTDGTTSIIEKYSRMDERIKAHYFQDNKGPYVRRNFAIERANSDFIVIQDADDIMCPTKLETLYNEITKNERLGVVGSFYQMFLDEFKGLEYTDRMELPIMHDEIMERYYSIRYVCWHGSAIIRKTMFEAIGLYDEHPYGSDRLWLAKMAEYARWSNDVRLKNVPEYLTLKREHPLSQQGLLPTLDPRSRRARFQTYWEYKLLKIREKFHNNPDVDIKAELRNCKCDDYIKRYGCFFEQWESQPLDHNILCSFISRGVRRFKEGKYVRCIIILDSVEKILNDVTKRFKNCDLLRAMAYFALDRKQESLKYLNREIENHNSPAAKKFISDYFENQLKTDLQSWCLENGRLYELRIIDLEKKSGIDRQRETVSDRRYLPQAAPSHAKAGASAPTYDRPQADRDSNCGRAGPLVSVIMPAYNAAEYITEAIKSVLNQTYKDYELVVINDGSTDRTEDIVLGFKDEKIKYFRQENIGAWGARNRVIKESKGNFIINLDTDDMMTPDFIAKHLHEFEKHPEADLIYCDDYLIEQNGKPIRVIKRPEYTNRKFLIRDLFRCGFPIVPFRTCIRKTVFDRIGFFDEGLVIGGDYDMMRRFVKNDLKIHHLDGALYLRRMTPNSLSRNYNAQKAKCLFEVVRRYTETFTYEELFPDVVWDEIAPQMRQLHAKCLTAGTYLAIGQEYVKTNATEYSRTAFDRACSELNDCLKMDPENQGLRQLLQKSKLIRARYTEAPQQLVSK